MQDNELVAPAGAFSYDGGVTDAEFWTAVGRALATRRHGEGYPSTKRIAKELAASPNERTLNAIEAGRPGHVTSLSEYCAVLGVPLTDLLASVLPGATATSAAMQIAREFDEAGPKVKKAVRAVLDAWREPQSPTARRHVPSHEAPRTSGSTGAGRQAKRS